MSSRVLVTADTHFCHDKAVEFRVTEGDDGMRGHRLFDSWEEMNEEIVYRWNQVVRPQDTVWHCGDVALCSGDPEKIKALDDVMQRLNGRFHLIMGNHDTMALAGQYFDRVWGVRDRKNCIMSHIPVAREQSTRFRLNIHGHLHQKQMMLPEELHFERSEALPHMIDASTLEVVERIDPWYYCASVEQHDYAPIPFADIIHERFHSAES